MAARKTKQHRVTYGPMEVKSYGKEDSIDHEESSAPSEYFKRSPPTIFREESLASSIKRADEVGPEISDGQPPPPFGCVGCAKLCPNKEDLTSRPERRQDASSARPNSPRTDDGTGSDGEFQITLRK